MWAYGKVKSWIGLNSHASLTLYVINDILQQIPKTHIRPCLNFNLKSIHLYPLEKLSTGIYSESIVIAIVKSWMIQQFYSSVFFNSVPTSMIVIVQESWCRLSLFERFLEPPL